MKISRRKPHLAGESTDISSQRSRHHLRYQLRPLLEVLEPRRLLAVELVSVTPGPIPFPFEAANDYSTNPVINGNGRFVAYQSHASNLVKTDSNDTQDVFVRDLLLGTNTLISVNADGTDSAACDATVDCSKSVTSGSFNPAISDDGRYVAFVSNSVDLVKGVVIDVVPNVYVRDRDADADGIFDETGPGETATTLLSIAVDGTAAGIVGGSGAATRPVISGNGMFVAFASEAPDMLVDDPSILDTNGTGRDVYRASVTGGAVTRINVDGTGSGTGFGGGTTIDLSINRSGSSVAFSTSNNGLVTLATNGIVDSGGFDVFVGNGNAPVELVTVNSSGTDTANDEAREPALSGNGRHVAFFSSATNLVAGAIDDNFAEDLFVRDLKSGITSLVSRSREVAGVVAGDRATPPSSLFDSEVTAGPAISDSGRFLAFRSTASDLLDPALGITDGDEFSDIFVLDRDPDEDGVFDEADETEMILVSVNAAGTGVGVHTDVGIGTAGSSAPSISANGRFVAFASTARDLVPGGTTFPGGHVYVRDLVTGVTSMVSRTGSETGIGPSLVAGTRFLAASRDGSRVAFQSDKDAADLDPTVTDPASGSPVGFGEVDIFAGTPDTDIVLGRNFASGLDTHTQSFRIRFEDAAAFELGYYRSSDDIFDAGDDVLGTLAISDPEDLMVDGNRFATALIGTDSGEIALPGIGSLDPIEDYFILAVGDDVDALREFDADPFNEDNTSALRGLYHVPIGPVFVHGRSFGSGDEIAASVLGDTLTIDYGVTGFGIPGTFTYDIADVTAVHIRTHDGDDIVRGSDLKEVVFGGPGSDDLSGNGGDDMLFGGPGKDRLDGGDGGDTLDGGEGPDTLIGGPGPDIFFDGPGDDLVDVGPGDDIIFATPGSNDLFIGSDDSDTIDFSLYDDAITIDLDSTALQVVDDAGNGIQLRGSFENFVGTSANDNLTIRPKPGNVVRQVDGGDGTDQLFVDAGGNFAINDGSRISFPGTDLGDIFLQGFESLFVSNVQALPTIIDNGDVGFASQGFTTINDPLFPQGFGDDIAFADPNDALSSTATWTFSDLPSGTYHVSTTWTAANDRATDAPFNIIVDGLLVDQVFINQEQQPQEFVDGGSFFHTLGVFDVRGNSLVVELTDGGDDFVIADAVRIEALQSQTIFIDDQPNRIGGGDVRTVHRASGSTLSLLSTLSDFTAELGGVDNGNASGSQSTGRRSINWDDVPDTFFSGSLFPDFYNQILPRGAVIQTDGQLRVSGSGDPGFPSRFEELNPTFPTAFAALTEPKLFTPLGSNVTDIRFFVPGSTQPAAVSGFGAVFSDVDVPFASKIEFFDVAGNLLRSEFVDPAAGDGQLSFLGVTFETAAVARVQITSGEAPIPLTFGSSPNDVTQGGPADLVVLDDFIYGEPIPLASPVGVGGFTSDCLPLHGQGAFADFHTCLPGESAVLDVGSIDDGTYLVSATWVPGSDRSPLAIYQIDGLNDIVVNQQLPPVGTLQGGHVRQPLARVEVIDGKAPQVTVVSDPSVYATTIVDEIQFAPAPDLQLFDIDLFPIENDAMVDLGSIRRNAQGEAIATRTLTVANVGSADLILSGLSTSTPGLSVSEFDAVRLPANSSTQFDLFINSSTPGPLSGQVTFLTNDFLDPVATLNITAELADDITPPTIMLTSPDEGAEVIEGSELEIRGSVPDCRTLDETCTVTIGNQTATVNPDGSFSIRQDLVSSNSFEVRVTDPAGNEGFFNRTINLIPDQPPMVQIISPTDGHGVVEGSSVQFTFEASDDVAVQRVELRVDNNLQDTLLFDGEGDQSVTGVTLSTINSIGDHEITICAVDRQGNSTCDQINVVAFPSPIIDFGKVIVAPGSDGLPQIRVTDGAGVSSFTFRPYPRPFAGGVRVATGDVNGDGILDIITGAGPGGGPHVKVFDGITGQPIHSFFAYDSQFAGGIFVASGDVTGDGVSDIIVAPGFGGGPNVRVFDGPSGSLISSFFAFTPSFSGGVRVAVGDVTGDGQDDIVVGAGFGGGPHVKVFDGHFVPRFPPTGIVTNGLLADFFAFDNAFTGGVFVATGNFDGDGRADILLGADENGSDNGGHVKVFDSAALHSLPIGGQLNGQGLLAEFFAFNPEFAGGVRVAAGDNNGDGTPDIITASGPGIAAVVNVFDGVTGAQTSTFDLGSGFSGSAVVSSDEPIVAVVNLKGDSPSHVIERDGNDVVVRNERGIELFRTPADAGKNIRLNAEADNDDELIVRTFGSDLSSTIIFDGGLGGFDSVRLEPGAGLPPLLFLLTDFVSRTHTVYANNPAGSGAKDLGLFVDLEPIDDLLDVVDREFVFADTDDHVDFNTGISGGDNLFRIDSNNSEVVDFKQASGTTHLNLGGGADVVRFDLPVNLLPSIDGQAGIDTFILAGSERHLDLTDPAQADLLNFERVDIIGDSPNSLTIDGQSVADATDPANTLVVIHDQDDTVNYAGNGWQVEAPIFVDDRQHHVLTNAAASSRVETINTLPWQNPLERTDVDFKSGTTALDALLIINFLGRFQTIPVDLPTPMSESELPDRYYDVNGSGTASALDALNVINFLGRLLASGEGETAGLETTQVGVRPNVSSESPGEESEFDRVLSTIEGNDIAIREIDWSSTTIDLPMPMDDTALFTASRRSNDGSENEFAGWDLALADLLNH